MTWAGCDGRGAIGRQSGHFVIVARSLRGDFHAVQCRYLVAGKLRHAHRASIQAPKALVLLGRQQHYIIASVTRHDHRDSVGDAAEAPARPLYAATQFTE
jgi:hypothetical protein